MIDCAVSSWLFSMIAIFPDGLGHPLGDLPDDRYLVAELDHDRTQVEHDRAALGLDERRVVVEQPYELALRPRRHLHPHRLHTRPFERGICRPIGARARETGQNGGEPFCAGGSRSAIAASTSTFAYSWSTDGVRDLRSDCVVLDHVARDRLEAVRVESRVLDVERDHPHEREQDRQDGQHACGNQTCPRRPLWPLGLCWLRSSRPSALQKRAAPAAASPDNCCVIDENPVSGAFQ